MATATLIASGDAYVKSGSSASKNFGTSGLLAAAGGHETYLLFGLPAAATSYVSAKLRLYGYDALAAASRAVTVARAGASWSEGKVTYKNRPTTNLGGSVSRTFTTAMAKGVVWEIDVLPLLQAALLDQKWFGLRVTSTSAATLRWYSRNSSVTSKRPQLVLEWAEAPATPSRLAPAGGRVVSIPAPVVSCESVDVTALQVQAFATKADALAETPVWDSGEVASSSAALDLVATTFPPLAVGGSIWWRIRVKGASGLWSGWSPATAFGYQPLGTVTITNPAGLVVTDATPPITWTTSDLQTAYQVRVLSTDGVELWTSGRITSTDQDATPPDGIVTTPGADYQVEVQAWDAYARELVPGGPVAAQQAKLVTYTSDGTVAGVTGLTAAPTEGGGPGVVLSWSRAELPDGFTVLRDGVVVASVTWEDVLIAGTSYQWIDPGVSVQRTHTWAVQAVVNGAGSTPTEVGPYRRTGDNAVWLADPAGELLPVMMWSSDDPSLELGGQSQWHEVWGGTAVLITQALRGFEGSVSGAIVPGRGIDPADMAARWDVLRAHPGRDLRLVIGPLELDVVVSDITRSPRSRSVEAYTAGFTFREQRVVPL